MKWKKQISLFLTMVCVSFTVIMLLYAGLSEWMEAELSVKVIFGLFAICAAVAVTVFLMGRIPIQSKPLRTLVTFIDICLVVFGFGGILGIVPFSLHIILIVLGMICAAYVGVLVAMFVSEQIAANDINQRISEMKHRGRATQKQR